MSSGRERNRVPARHIGLACFRLLLLHLLLGGVAGAQAPGGQPSGGQPPGGRPPGGSGAPDSGLFGEVYRHVKNLALYDPDDAALVQASVQGLLGSLDPYSALIPPDEWRLMAAQSRGELAGVGLTFVDAEGGPVTEEPALGSPAAAQGIKSRQRLVSIGGRQVTGGAASASLALLGAVGSRVVVELAGLDGSTPRSVVLVRTREARAAVESHRLGDGRLVHLRIGLFSAGSARQIAERLEELRAGPAFEGLVIDLTHNPGGLLEEAVAAADLFVPSGLLLSVAERKGRRRQEMLASGKAVEAEHPLVLLVDGATASAAEAFVAALRERGRAVVAGERTFGKATLQDYVPLSDGSALRLTRAQYLTPSGRFLQGRGIVPDLTGMPKGATPDEVVLHVGDYVVKQWSRLADRRAAPMDVGGGESPQGHR